MRAGRAPLVGVLAELAFEPGDFELRADAEPLALQSFGRRSDGRREDETS